MSRCLVSDYCQSPFFRVAKLTARKDYLLFLAYFSLSLNLKRKIKTLLFVFLLWAGCVCNAYASVSEKDKTKESLKELKAKIQQIEELMESKNESVKKAHHELKETGLVLDKMATLVRQLAKKEKKLIKEINALDLKVKHYGNEIDKQKQAFESELIYMFYLGQTSTAKLLLNAKKPSKVSRTLKYFQYLEEGRLSKISAFEVMIKQFEKAKESVIEKRATLKQAKEESKEKKKELELTRRKHQKDIEALKNEIKKEGLTLHSLQENESRLGKLLESLVMREGKEAIAGGRKFVKLKGKLPMPTMGKLKKVFGRKRNDSSLKWNGIIIESKLGQSVKAVHPGLVVYANWLLGFGMLIIVDHFDGYMSLYGHNESLLKKMGSQVEANEVIATVGNSGGRLKPGLYFELRKDGAPLNPVSWLKATR